MTSCKIDQIGKHRNGKPKYWCKVHFSTAYSDSIEIPDKCQKYDQPRISEEDKFRLNPKDWDGGVGIWGALDPVYNTSTLEGHHPGIHLHARALEDGEKQIDYTFKEIEIKTQDEDLFEEDKYIKLDTEIAHAYTASMVFGKELKYLLCTHCGKPHIDADYFSVTYHKKHMCTYCGREFRDVEPGISNPVVEIQRIFHSSMKERTIELVERTLNINQKDYPGGIQIWGSNPAIIWTAKRSEEAGIHVHVYNNAGDEALQDDTYGKVIIDGIELNGAEIRYLMVQQSLSHLIGKIKAFNCPECNNPHCDKGDYGIRPHEHHLCEFCNNEFTTAVKCVGNPIIEKLQQLKNNYEALQK